MNIEYIIKDMMMYKKIFKDNSEFKIWKKLPNNCYIGTLGYSLENAKILETLLQSFAEQYGEVIDLEAAKEELKLYSERGKLLIYFDEFLKPVSMNGIIYNEDNISVDFKKSDGTTPTNLYFYGLSTIHEYRGKGACRALIEFAINYAYFNGFDLVYARTDLTNSNSEWLMAKKGMEICTFDNSIITEWVDVTEGVGDYRLHMWLPLKKGLMTLPKEGSILSDYETREVGEVYSLKKVI